MPKIWLNGAFVDEEAARISPRDTGLLHGAGVFTTMRAYKGKVFRLADHLARLRRSCEALFVPLQCKDVDLLGAVDELIALNALEDARLRLTATRGETRPDPVQGVRVESTVLLTASPLEPYPAAYYHRGLTVIVLDEYKLNPYDVQAGHKTVNYLSRLWALREAGQRGAGEALWFNVHNFLQSGSISNVFLAKGGKLRTPPTREDLHDPAVAKRVPYAQSSVLPGVTRKVVLELVAANGLEWEAAALSVNDLLEADEVFVTNSIMGIMPVCRIERKPIGEDRPGPLTTRISEWYEDEVRASLG